MKPLLDRAIKKIEPEKVKQVTFLSFFDELVERSKKGLRLHPKTSRPISSNTLRTYVTTFKHLTAFEKTRKQKLDFAGINLDFYSDYTEYLMKSLKLSANTVGKHIQIIKLIMNEATEKGLNTNLSFKSKRFITVREKSDNIYLTDKEITEIERLDLSGNPRLEKVRDLFVIGCKTGLRFSDYSILRPDLIEDGFIETTQTKTGDNVVIPIHTSVQNIIEKYNGKLPRAISNQKTNNYLKEIGQIVPSLQKTFTRSFTKKLSKISKN